MKRTALIAGGLAAALTMAGCATTPGGTTPSIPTAPDISSIISQVQADAASVCQLVPLGSTITNLIPISGSAANTAKLVETIVGTVCQFAQAAPPVAKSHAFGVRRGGAVTIGTYEGVPIVVYK